VIDVRKKPRWFLEMNPTGKLPAVVHDGRLLLESAPIVEYVEDVFPEPCLLAADPYERWRARFLLQTINTEFVPAFYRLLLDNDDGTLEKRRGDLSSIVGDLSAGLGAEQGPYFLGARFTLVDATLYPFIERMNAQLDIRGYEFPQTDGLATWQRAVEGRPSVARTRLDPGYILDIYRQYVAGSCGRTYFEANPGGE